MEQSISTMELGDARENMQRNSDNTIDDDTQGDFDAQSVDMADLGANLDAINVNGMWKMLWWHRIFKG